MKAILYDILLIVLGVMLMVLRDYYATLGFKKPKTPEERAQMVGNRMYQAKKWNAFIVGACFVLFGGYLLYLNLMKIGQ